MPAPPPIELNRLLDYRPRGLLLTMDEAARRGLLAELLAAPSEPAWQALLELFLLWPEGDGRQQALDDTVAALDGWPSGLRALASGQVWLYRPEGLSDLVRLVRSMSLYRCDLDDSRELSAIADSPHAAGLTELKMVRCSFSDPAWQRLLDSRYLAGLKRLLITRCILREEVTRGLLETRAFPRLTALRLAGVGLTEEGLAPAREQLPFPRLTALGLSDNPLGDQGARLIAAAPWLTGITRLELDRDFLSAAGVAALIEAPAAHALRYLDVSGNDVAAAAYPGLRTRAARRGIELIL